jgi:hypothetical protein
MKFTLLSIAILTFTLQSNGLAGEAPKIDASVQEQVQSSGRARVLVRLNVPDEAEVSNSAELREARREAIARAHAAVLRELEQTQYKLYPRDMTAATLSMEVGSDALQVLGKSIHVRKVDRVLKVKGLADN